MVSQSIRIGKIFGIEIGVNYSWFIVFGLVTVILAAAYFPQEYPDLSRSIYILLGLITSLLFFVSVLLHELSHSLIARMNNIPIKSITLFIFGGVSNMTKEPDSPGAEFLMAMAGPVASLVLAGVFGGIWLVGSVTGMGVLVVAPAMYLTFINFMLAIFNLIPGFPLDGGRVVRAVLWYATKDLRKATRIVSWMGQGFAITLIALGLYLLFASREFWPNGIWFIFIGWFLWQLATSGYQEIVLRGSLAGVYVTDIMTREVRVIDGSLNLNDAVNEFFMRYKHGRFPVKDETGQIKGIVTLHHVRDVPRDEWHDVSVNDITSTLTKTEQITSNATAEEALMRMAEGRTGHLLVMDDGRLDGIVTKSDLMDIIQMRTRLGV